MENELKTQQLLQRIITLLENDFKPFLSYEKAKLKGADVVEYEKGVYKYYLNGVYHLVEDGELLVESSRWGIEWYQKGTYQYINDDGYTILVEDGKVIFNKDVSFLEWREKGVYWYDKHRTSRRTLVENNEVVVSNADYINWEKKGFYHYSNDDKYTIVKNGKVILKDIPQSEVYEGVKADTNLNK